jgi:hypothetical protein
MARLETLHILPAAPGWEVSSGREPGIVFRELREALQAAAECFQARVTDLQMAGDGRVSLKAGRPVSN